MRSHENADFGSGICCARLSPRDSGPESTDSRYLAGDQKTFGRTRYINPATMPLP
jgi:hypothetical protein